MPLKLLDLVASYDHYESHLRPIWDALDDDFKGEERIGSEQALQIPKRNRVALVGAWRDMEPLRGMCEFVYVEHGAGQSYGGDPRSAHFNDYSASGGNRHQGVIGYICPNQRVADLWAPKPAVAVGCPRLDPYHLSPRPVRERTACLNFHWPCQICPEAGTAYGWYRFALGDIVRSFREQGWEVVAHLHPRWQEENAGLDIFRDLENAGVGTVSNDYALSCAILVSDNSSTMYEAAALGRHVIALNKPQYRRDVRHGLRFWDAVPGLQIDEPEALMSVELDRVLKSPQSAHLRDIAAEAAFGPERDGKAAQRAAEAIMNWLS